MAASGLGERDGPMLGDIADYELIYSVVEAHYPFDETKIQPEFHEAIKGFIGMEVPKHLLPDNPDDLTAAQLLEVVGTMFETYRRTNFI